MTSINDIQPGSIVRGPTLPEPVEVLATAPMGDALKIIGRGMQTGMTHDPVLTPAQIADLVVSADREPFDGDARLFRLGIRPHSMHGLPVLVILANCTHNGRQRSYRLAVLLTLPSLIGSVARLSRRRGVQKALASEDTRWQREPLIWRGRP